MKKIKLTHTGEAILNEARLPPVDPRSDHRAMLKSAEERHWRVLKHLSNGLGKSSISKIEECGKNMTQRSYYFLKLHGYIELNSQRRHALTTIGAAKLAELEKS